MVSYVHTLNTHTHTTHTQRAHTITHNARTQSHTQELKWSTRYHRVRSVHVTPTVFLNGLETSEISSSFTAAEWQDKINNILAQAKVTSVSR